MIEHIFDLLKLQPALSISLGFVLAGFLAFVFKDLIAQWVKKRYNLYNEKEIRTALKQADEKQDFYAKNNVTAKLRSSIEDSVMRTLKR